MNSEIYDEKNLRYILSLPPYQFMTLHLDKLMTHYSSLKYSKDQISSFNQLYGHISRDLNKDINEMLRLVEIEEGLVKLLEGTDNKIFYRKLFFPSIFINNEFKFEDWIIKGLLVEEVFSEFKNGIARRSLSENTQNNDYIIFLSAINPSTKEFLNTSFFLISEGIILGDKDDKIINRIEKYYRNIICNIVDMVEGNDEDLELTRIETSKGQNEKRIKKGKIPFPTKIYIRPKGEFKQYVKKFNMISGDERKIGHKFLVRGHWRNFRDERYKYKKGEKTWIKPFWKGEGIVISKDYKLISSIRQ